MRLMMEVDKMCMNYDNLIFDIITQKIVLNILCFNVMNE